MPLWLKLCYCYALLHAAFGWNTDFESACAAFSVSAAAHHYDGWDCFASYTPSPPSYAAAMDICRAGDGGLLTYGHLAVTSGRSYAERLIARLHGAADNYRFRVGLRRVSAEPAEHYGTFAYEDAYGNSYPIEPANMTAVLLFNAALWDGYKANAAYDTLHVTGATVGLRLIPYANTLGILCQFRDPKASANWYIKAKGVSADKAAIISSSRHYSAGGCASACSASPLCVTFSHSAELLECRLHYTELNNTLVPPVPTAGFYWWER